MVKSTKIGKRILLKWPQLLIQTLNFNENYIFGKLSSIPFDVFIIYVVSGRSEFSHLFGNDVTVQISENFFMYSGRT